MPEDKLILFQKIYDFVLWLYPLVNRIPKSHRPILGKEIEKLALSLLILVIAANKSHGETRRNQQFKISDELDKLRILIRLTKDLKFISIKQYAFAAEKLNEVGKILCGWIKSNGEV